MDQRTVRPERDVSQTERPRMLDQEGQQVSEADELIAQTPPSMRKDDPASSAWVHAVISLTGEEGMGHQPESHRGSYRATTLLPKTSSISADFNMA